MKKQWVMGVVFCAAALHSHAALAANELALANTKGCMACHAVDKKVIGPSYKEVAAKYAGDKSASAKLVPKVLNGGSGVWGPVAMPANKTAGVTEADAKKLVGWILGLK